MSKGSGAERRRFIRIEPNPGAPIRVDINGDGFIDIIEAIDISEGGVGLKVAHGFKGCDLNKPVSFIIEIPSSPKNIFLQAQGKIIHVYGNRFGISFHNLSEMARIQIKKYIAGRLKEDSFVTWLKYKFGAIQ